MEMNTTFINFIILIYISIIGLHLYYKYSAIIIPQVFDSVWS